LLVRVGGGSAKKNTETAALRPLGGVPEGTESLQCRQGDLFRQRFAGRTTPEFVNAAEPQYLGCLPSAARFVPFRAERPEMHDVNQTAEAAHVPSSP
jgi:hypothetical protein